MGLALSVLIIISLKLNAGKLSRAYEALEIYDYFKAKKLFYQSLKKKKSGAALGLSIIFARNDNPFHHLDSARKYILIADSSFQKLETKERLRLRDLGVTDSLIRNWSDSISSNAFKKAARHMTISTLDEFLVKYPNSLDYGRAVHLRDSIAFSNKKQFNTSEAYKSFMKEYPNSIYYLEANNRYQECLFKEIQDRTKTGERFKQFIYEYPSNPYVGQAQDSVFSRYCSLEVSINSYHRFIKENPNNRNIAKAWRSLYKLYTATKSPEKIVEFRFDYPDYPFKDELKIDFERSAQFFFPYRVGELWGYKNKKGQIMIRAQYEYVASFKEGAALVIKDDQVGYINKMNEQIIPCQYEDGEDFSNGVVPVFDGSYFGLINKLNQTVLAFEYDFIGSSSDNLLLVSKDNKYGYSNVNGELIIPISFQKAYDFYRGLAVVQQNGFFGAINTKGDTIIPFAYKFLEPFSKYDLARAKKDSLFGVIDRNGAVIIPFEYDQISSLEQKQFILVKSEKYAYAKLDGDLITEFQFDYEPGVLISGIHSKRYAKVLVNGKYGIIDSLGNKVFPAIFEDVGQYTDSTYIAVKKRGKWGYSNQNLRLVIPYKYEEAKSFINDNGFVRKEDQWFSIDKEGNTFPLGVEQLESLNAFFILKKDSKNGIMDRQANILIEPVYDRLISISEEWVQLLNNEEVLYFNKFSGQMLSFKE